MSLKTVPQNLPGSFTHSEPVCPVPSTPLQSSVVGERSSPVQKDQVPGLAGFCSGIPTMSAKTGWWRLRQEVPTGDIFFLLKMQGSETKRRIGCQQLAKTQEDITDNAFVEKKMHHAFRFQMLMCFLDCYLLCLFFGLQGDRKWVPK